MSKKIVFTAAGILLSFAIAVGGWVFTSWLIDIESHRLLSGTTSFLVDIPTMESTHPNNENDDPNIRLGLTTGEIVSILQNWELIGNRRPHEPAAGQINMEQAIESGRLGLDFLYNQNALPEEVLEFSNVRATLNQNTPYGGQFLPLRYSYWNVRFINDYVDVIMTINAVTGQVWRIEVSTTRQRMADESSSQTYRFETQVLLKLHRDEVISMLADFIADLEIHTDPNPISFFGNLELVMIAEYATERNDIETILVYQTFADSNAAAIISAIGVPTPDGMLHFERFNIFLTPWTP